MHVTREVIDDLLPGYLYGDVSADTRALVREFLEQHPELARSVEYHQKDASAHGELLEGAADMTLSPDLELHALNRTKRMLERRGWLFAIAVTFSIVPMSFTFDKGITWMMVRDVPRMAAVYWAAGLGFWIALVWTNRRLRSSGL